MVRLFIATHDPMSVKTIKKSRKSIPTLLKCRCGGDASKPEKVTYCTDRWRITCSIETCHAANCGQGLAATIYGWNQLAQHVYR